MGAGSIPKRENGRETEYGSFQGFISTLSPIPSTNYILFPSLPILHSLPNHGAAPVGGRRGVPHS